MQGERRIRGSALYQYSSCMNHDCMPNAARVDDPDDGSTSSTYMRVRLLHKIPAGEQICISYFPMHLELCERRERCSDLYGFSCTCMRCMVRPPDLLLPPIVPTMTSQPSCM